MLKKNWSRDELILAFNLYCKIPFGRIHIHNPEIIDLAKLLGRSPSAVSWKLANFASFDPALKKRKIIGAAHTSKLDAEIWDEFNNDWGRLGFESEKLYANLTGKILDDVVHIETDDLFQEGKERESLVKIRVNQGFFRKSVLAAYDIQCCVTGLSIPELLNASHIIPWSVDAINRVNPQNGLCLNAIHDRAFDRGLITIMPDYSIKVSTRVKNIPNDLAAKDFIVKFDGHKIRLPSRFLPKTDFLTYHNINIFQG
jgi:putative restriction endonuclease